MPVPFGFFDQIHRIGTSEVVQVVQLIFLSNHIEGIVAVSISSVTFVYCKALLTSEHCPFAVFHFKVLGEPLSNSIQVWRLNLCSDLKVVLAVDKCPVVGRKQNRPSVPSSDFEIEGIDCVLKSHLGNFDGEAGTSIWVFGKGSPLRHFKSGTICVGDFDYEVGVSMNVEEEDEVFDDGTGGFDVVGIFASILQGEYNGSAIFGNFGNFVLRDGQAQPNNENQED